MVRPLTTDSGRSTTARSCTADGRCGRIEGRRWLLVKRRDDEADGPDPVAERPESVVSGRTIEELERVIEPMKAVLTDEPFSDPDWIFERKLDGIRCLATRDAAGVRSSRGPAAP